VPLKDHFRGCKKHDIIYKYQGIILYISTVIKLDDMYYEIVYHTHDYFYLKLNYFEIDDLKMTKYLCNKCIYFKFYFFFKLN
jgi:hypothetical protein